MTHREAMDTLAARRQMVEQQIRAWEVLDGRVLEVLGRVPREAFVPPAYREVAFADAPIPIGKCQMMLAPSLQGRILQALAIDPQDRVLEIGAGTGYLCACMSLLARSAKSIDIHADFIAQTRLHLAAVPGASVELETRDAFDGAPLGEYDAIALTGSLPLYDARFERALKPGGRLFAVVGAAPAMEAILVRRVDDSEWIRESLFETDIEPLLGAPAPAVFVF